MKSGELCLNDGPAVWCCQKGARFLRREKFTSIPAVILIHAKD